jgi:hypothetical protein
MFMACVTEDARARLAASAMITDEHLVSVEPYRPGEVAVEKEVGVVLNCPTGVTVVVNVVGVS